LWKSDKIGELKIGGTLMFTSQLLAPAELHIPDGFLSTSIALLLWIISVIFIVLAVRNLNKSDNEKLIPLMGIMAAFIFAAQMINFPIAGGTSGHFLGGVLAAITIGPWAGILVMTAVISVQALIFQDGGLLVMGANIFNMGILTALIGFGFYRAVNGQKFWIKAIAISLAAWLSVMAGALATGLELWLSGTTPLEIVMPAMLGIHALIGVGEAVITVAAYALIARTRPDIIDTTTTKLKGGLGWVIAGFATAVVVVLLAPLASADPDGLERVAEDLGFLSLGMANPYNLIPDYTVPFLGETPLSTILAGLIGAAIVALVVILIARLINRQTVSG
jgi:cobalt/nickel transport system permease protein